jgi:DnaJ-domain-containing protein 1
MPSLFYLGTLICFWEICHPAMAFKDYYKTLDVPPNASTDAVKKKFRKLALQYHPDINAGNEFSALQFRELQEAYEILSHPSKRAKYHFEWQLHFPNDTMHSRQIQSPVSVLESCIRLDEQLSATDLFRVNKEAIFLRIQTLLSPVNKAILLQHNDESLNQQVITRLLSASSELPFKYIASIAAELKTVAGANKDSITMITDFVKLARRKSYWEQYYPLMVLLLSLAICGLIYIVSK